MKIKEGLTVSTSDFWYDLTEGGYLDPFIILQNADDAKTLQQAIDLVLDFERSCNEQIEGFSQ